MGQKAGFSNSVAVFGMIVLGVSAQALAEVRPEVVERISPIGKVEVAGEAKAVAVLPAADKEPTPAAGRIAEPVPAAAPVPAGSDGASLYAAKGCSACHGPDGRKTILSTYPKLAGQGSQYLIAQMNDIKSGARSHGQTMIMKGVIDQVSEPEIQAIADWLSGL